MKNVISAFALVSAPVALAFGFMIASANPASASHAALEHIELDPAYVIVDQVGDAPMATGALDVEEVQITQPLEVSVRHLVPSV